MINNNEAGDTTIEQQEARGLVKWLAGRSPSRKMYFIAILCFALLFGVYARLIPLIWNIMGVDFNETYLPAARALAAGQNPYTVVPSFFNPVWTLLPFIPLSYFPSRLAVIVFFFITIAIFLFVGFRLRAKPVAFTAFLLSPAILISLRQLNIDSFVMLGFLMPAQIGLFFVLAKPQLGLGMIIYWLVDAWQSGGVRKVVFTFTPVTGALAATFILYGNWIGAAGAANLMTTNWNYSLWPWGVLLGLALLAAAFGLKKKYLAASAGPLFSPYVGLYSWPVALVGLFDNDLLMVGAVLTLWIMVVIHL
jgi:hypothetical protein